MSQPQPAFTPLGAIGVTAAAVATFLVVRSIAIGAGASAFVGLVISQLALAGVAIGAAVIAPRPLAAIGVVRPGARFVIAALLVGTSLWFVNLRLALLMPFTDRHPDVARLEQLIYQPPVALGLLGIALVPAVCEELVFRGLLLRGLAARFIPAVAVAVTALVFSAYHLSVVQLVPTLVLGLATGVLAQRSGSVVPAVIVHLLNNGIVLLVQRELVPLRWMAEHPDATLAITGATTAGGLALALRGGGAR